MNKFSKLLNKINSIESYTRDMVLKFLPEPSHEQRRDSLATVLPRRRFAGDGETRPSRGWIDPRLDQACLARHA